MTEHNTKLSSPPDRESTFSAWLWGGVAEIIPLSAGEETAPTASPQPLPATGTPSTELASPAPVSRPAPSFDFDLSDPFPYSDTDDYTAAFDPQATDIVEPTDAALRQIADSSTDYGIEEIDEDFGFVVELMLDRELEARIVQAQAGGNNRIGNRRIGSSSIGERDISSASQGQQINRKLERAIAKVRYDYGLSADDPLLIYLREVYQIPRITATDEAALAMRIEAGRQANAQLQALGINSPVPDWAETGSPCAMSLPVSMYENIQTATPSSPPLGISGKVEDNGNVGGRDKQATLPKQSRSASLLNSTSSPSGRVRKPSYRPVPPSEPQRLPSAGKIGANPHSHGVSLFGKVATQDLRKEQFQEQVRRIVKQWQREVERIDAKLTAMPNLSEAKLRDIDQKIKQVEDAISEFRQELTSDKVAIMDRSSLFKELIRLLATVNTRRRNYGQGSSRRKAANNRRRAEAS